MCQPREARPTMDTEHPSPLDSVPPSPAAQSVVAAADVRRGIGVSPGVATGRALVFRRAGALPMAEQAPAAPGAVNPDAERERVLEAIAAAAAELRALAASVARDIGEAEAGIFEAQALMLEDP